MSKLTTFRQMLLAALAVAAVAGACYPFAAHIGYRSVALILLLAVSVLAARMGLAAVVTAAVLSAMAWNFLFVPPHFTLRIQHAEDVLFMASYFVVAMLNGVINYRLRQVEAIRSEKTERENALKLYNTLFNSLSHDLRTPLAAVIGAADMLRENRSQLPESQQVKLLDEISDGSLRLSAQVENLLNMSRIEAGMIQPKKEWCDLADLLHGLVKKAGAATHPIETKLPENLPLVQLDHGLTERTLENLLQNALRHTPEGGRITLSATLLHERRGSFRQKGVEFDGISPVRTGAAERLSIEVRDSGPGFPEGELERVFDKFYRLGDARPGGSGLGLFIARGFAEGQGGSVSLRNLPGGGACFTVELPVEVLEQGFHAG